jgi:tetratricopeptide (TPR) repeat protein
MPTGDCRTIGLLSGKIIMRLPLAATLLAVLAPIALASPPAAVQVKSPIELTTDPADKAVMAEAAAAVAERPPTLARLDAVLAKLPRPTPLRGMIQSMRAPLLLNGPDHQPAVAAIDEALRLLPDHPLPKMIAVEVFTFSGAPQRAADLWIALSQQAPEFARQSQRYTMLALVGRLHDLGDRTRADRVSARLGEIGFTSALAPERSGFAVAQIRDAVRAGRTADAIAAVPTVGDPGDLVSMFVDKRYAALWPRITEWSGGSFDAPSRRYLEELRSDWNAADDFQTATPYARELASLHAYDAVVALFLPVFDRAYPEGYGQGAETLAPIVARALTTLGRAAEGQALLARVAAKLPREAAANALNIDAAYVTLAVGAGEWAQAVARADTFLTRAKGYGSSVNSGAIVGIQAYRACALHQLGRADEAQRAKAEVMLAAATNPSRVADMLACTNDEAGLRQLVIDRLADADTRAWALGYVQPYVSDQRVPLDRLTDPVRDRVRTHPQVIAAATGVGRILPAPVGGTLPTGFEPYRTPPPAKPIGKDAV